MHMASAHGGFSFSVIECPPSATPSARGGIVCLEAEETLEPEPSAKSMSNLTSASGEASFSSETRSGCHEILTLQQHERNSGVAGTIREHSGNKRKRSLPGNPDPEAEVIALSPKTLMTTNRFICEICGKGFQRDQNLQLHRRGHNLPWKLRQRTAGKEVKKRVYVCPEQSCVHHHSSRALGDLTGIKKHFCRKHGEKKWKCDKCSKKYAVQSDWKAHRKTCGTREYRCDCGTLFSRRDSFITHRAFCDALAEESARISLFKSEGIQLPYTGQENYFGSPVAMAGASCRTSSAPSFRSIPNFLGMTLPPFDVALPPPASRPEHDVPSTRQGASSSADSFLVQLHSNSPANLFAPCARMSFLSGSEIGTQGAGLSGSYQMVQFNRLPAQSDRLMEAKSQNILPGNGFQEPCIRITQKQNVPKSGKQLQCQSSFSTSHGLAQEKLMGSLFSSVEASEGRASNQSPVHGQNFRCASGVAMGAVDLGLSNTRQYQQRERASPVAGLHLSLPDGSLVRSQVSKNINETNSGLSISSMHQKFQTPRPQMSATALLQKAAQMGAIFSDSSRKHCLDIVESEAIPNPPSLTSKISSCQGGDSTLIRSQLDGSVHSISSQKIRQPSQLYPAMDSALETRAIPIERSTSQVQGIQCMQQTSSLGCHAKTSCSLPFSLGILDNQSINESNVVKRVDRSLVGSSTSTAENITNGGEQMYGAVSFSRATPPIIEGDSGKELIYEKSTRDFLGVGGDIDGLRGIALEGNITFLSQENTGISLDLSPSMNSLRKTESLNAWRLVGSRMGI